MSDELKPSPCKFCKSGYFDGTDVECVNGVLIDIDVATEGWESDVAYPPAPCIAKEWNDGEKDGWFGECQNRLNDWSDRGDPIAKTAAPADAGLVARLSWVEIAQSGYADWAAKEHNAKWVRRIDGTPIPNDMTICIGEAFASELTRLSTELAEARAERDKERMINDCHCVNVEALTNERYTAESRLAAAEAENARLIAELAANEPRGTAVPASPNQASVFCLTERRTAKASKEAAAHYSAILNLVAPRRPKPGEPETEEK